MNKGRVILISIIVVIVILLGLLGFYIFSVIEDMNETKATGEEIVSSFEVFKENVITFSNMREDVTMRMNEELYYDVISSLYDEYVLLFKEYGSLADDIEDSSDFLKDKCVVTYVDSNVQQKCDAFRIMYEESINLFIYDVKRFNVFVETFNTTSESSLELFNSGYEGYIDYDNDEVFLGSEG